ncbi:hypothetical protein [Devosia sp. SL43]|uniref:hypothetical protein n=1 Tax=Devosia sp. SL43 TaxID=2806348 RepID=UPI001F2CE788|nr:hypothetical protein [Devosia sp. SL43]UJW87251.1 hypothetical protein IM737_08435 [Devosia sp. SL43]
MADYKELLRRAISALPENNGAARRAVYEKARSALVGQLRAITPPLPARDITQHRLQLEDCIRQVEQEASEAIITLGRDAMAPRPVEAAKPPEPKPVEPPKPAAIKPVETKPVVVPEAPKPAPVAEKSTDTMSIEEIIEQAAATSGAKVSEVQAAKPKIDSRPSRSEPSSPPSNVRQIDAPLKSPSFEPRRDSMPLAANSAAEPIRSSSRIEPSISGNQAVALQVVTPLAVAHVEPALSSVREVELEAIQPADTIEAEGAIASAIETLDREARGETTPELPEPAQVAADRMFAAPRSTDSAAVDDSGFASTAATGRSGPGLTIFLIVFVILLAGVGGAGFWAWREGYIDLDQMFNQPTTTVAEATDTPAVPTPTLDPVEPAPAVSSTDPAAAPGNTATNAATEPSTALEGLELEDRLEPTPEPVVPTGNETTLPDLGTGEIKTEERLPGQDATTVAANDPAASVDPAVLAGSQSLLLEASPSGTTGAVPFSGTVEWSEGVDELGLPTLIGHASIPARNLGVNVTIRKNSDPSLPASHLMEVDFEVNDTFIGGTIASLPGVLLKDEELVPGTPLVGASARVVGNSFLFALSASPDDATANTDLLENRKWMDLAVVYGTGRNAIITLEKDETAQALFDKVFGTWTQ